jgi:hypothetical protein
MGNQQELTVGAKYLGPSGRIWTVDSIPPRGNRIVLTSPGPDGTCAAIMDTTAVLRMIPLEQLSTPVPTSHADPPPAARANPVTATATEHSAVEDDRRRVASRVVRTRARSSSAGRDR